MCMPAINVVGFRKSIKMKSMSQKVAMVIHFIIKHIFYHGQMGILIFVLCEMNSGSFFFSFAVTVGRSPLKI